jgi:hypothetical protein
MDILNNSIKNITAMETFKINRGLLLIVLMLLTTVSLCFFVDFEKKLAGLDKQLGNKDLADFNWTFAR